MAFGLIRGFHFLLAGLIVGAGVGTVVACGVLFQYFADQRPTALLLSYQVLDFLDPLRTAAVLALVASSAALLLRSRPAAARVRVGLVLVLVVLQSWHIFGIKPGLALDPAGLSATSHTTSNSAAAVRADASVLRRTRQMFGVLLAQSLLAAVLLVTEGLWQPLSPQEIAERWRETLGSDEDADGD